MSTTESSKPYPTFPASCWWPLRERFKRSMPATVDIAYLQSVLGVERKTGRNLVPMLRLMGLVDEGGAPTERAGRWRIDSEYAAVCRQIRDEIYPSSLRLSVPAPADDPDGCVRWFMTSTRVGEAAARRMARFYTLLSTADPAQAGDARGGARSSTGVARTSTPKPDGGGPPAPGNPAANPSIVRNGVPPADVIDIGRTDGPVAVVLQLVIGPDTSPEQIDHVFASIARHLGPVRQR